MLFVKQGNTHYISPSSLFARDGLYNPWGCQQRKAYFML